MADIINLNKARKNRDRAVKEARAGQNRVAFGQKKSEQKARKDEDIKQSQKLDGSKIKPPDHSE